MRSIRRNRESECGVATILETDRLLLREMEQADLPALCRMLQDPDVMWAYGHAFSDEEAPAR